MEPATGLMVLGAAIGSAKLLEKLLGPTADYLGGELRSYAEKGLQNLGRIFKNAEKRLGEDIENPGQVPPKVLKEILEEGYFCEDNISAEYFGGVLASSRSEISRDDRGASYISLIGRLSTYQVRAHYVFYTVFKKLHNGKSVNLGISTNREKLKTFIPDYVFDNAMDIQKSKEINVLITHIMSGLTREELIADNWTVGSPEHIKEISGLKVDSPGIVFLTSAVGFELYLWAYGYGRKIPIQKFLDTDLVFKQIEDVTIPGGFIIPE